MLNPVQKCLVVMVLALLPLSCTKIPQWATPGQGNVAIEPMPTKDSIPLKWGNLVSVATSPEVRYGFELWFQDEQGNLRMVVYDIQTNNLSANFRFIPRK
jgi:hypothetical protein